jgi:hypothetical protein
MKITFKVNSNHGHDTWVQAEGPGPRLSSVKKIKALSQDVHLYTAHQGIISPSGNWDITASKDEGQVYRKTKRLDVMSRPMDDNWVVTITINPDSSELGFDLTLAKK